MAWTVPWNYIGLEVSGDVGNLTIYTNKNGKKVAFPKSPPKEPPSERQVNQRLKFKNGQKAWTNLTDQVKSNLEEATKKVNAPLTGQNIYISSHIRKNNDDLITFERQSGITLPRVPE